MVRVKFKSEIWKSGNSYVVTIPKQYVKDGWLKTGTSYEFEVEAQPEEAKVPAAQSLIGPSS